VLGHPDVQLVLQYQGQLGGGQAVHAQVGGQELVGMQGGGVDVEHVGGDLAHLLLDGVGAGHGRSTVAEQQVAALGSAGQQQAAPLSTPGAGEGGPSLPSAEASARVPRIAHLLASAALAVYGVRFSRACAAEQRTN